MSQLSTQDDDRKSRGELLVALKALLDWEAHTGGWEAPCWRKAKRIVAKAEGR